MLCLFKNKKIKKKVRNSLNNYFFLLFRIAIKAQYFHLLLYMQKINSLICDIIEFQINKEESIHLSESESEPKSFNPSQELFFTPNEKENDNISCESDNFEQINKKEDLTPSQIISDKFYENPEEKVDNLVIDLSSINDNGSNIRLNDNKELNNTNEKSKIFFINQKRKFSDKKPKKTNSIFTPRENDDNLIKLIKKISIENFDDVSKTSKKYKLENIYKKIKGYFLKHLKIIANLNLKSKRCKKRFTFLQPTFVNTTNKDLNKMMFKKTFKDVILTDMREFMKDKNTKNTDETNYERNISVLEHLERNKYHFDFLDMTIIDLYIEYLNSKEFEMDIINLKNNKKEDIKYIKYIFNQAKNTVNYFA